MPKRAPFHTVMLFAVLSVIGWALLPLLDIQWQPSPRGAKLRVSYQWPGVGPALLEDQVTSILEGGFAMLAGVERMYSVSNHGGGYIELDIADYTHLDYFRFEIAAKIRQLYPKLPSQVTFPQVQLQDAAEALEERPILIYALSGNANPAALKRYAQEQLIPQLALESGLETIQVEGGQTWHWTLFLDPSRLKQLDVSPREVEGALKEHLRSSPLGLTTVNQSTTFLELKTAIGDTVEEADLLSIPIRWKSGKLITLGQLGKVWLVPERAQQYFRINGQNSIRLLFHAGSQVNTIQLAKKVRKRLENLELQLPQTYVLHLEDDATIYLKNELSKIQRRTLLSLGILLLFTLAVYQSLGYLLLIVLSLLANLGLAFIGYYYFEVELHLYALAGITVSFGIVIDNTIVMAHHLKHHRNKEIFPALLAATLTSISALIVIFALPEQWKFNLMDFAKVMIINLSVSLLIAWSLIPALRHYLQRDQQKRRTQPSKLRKWVAFWGIYRSMLRRLLRIRSLVVIVTILTFGLPVFMLPNRIPEWDWYNRTLGTDWYIEEVKPMVNRVLGGTFRLFSWYVYEGSAYRQPEETALFVQGNMPQGTTIEQMDAVFQQMDRYLQQYPSAIKQFTTRVNSGQFGQTVIYFKSKHNPSFPHILKSRLIAYSLQLGGVKWRIFGVGQGFSNGVGNAPPTFRLALKGFNKVELVEQAEILASRLSKHPRIQTVNTDASINWWEKKLYEYQLNWRNEALASQRITRQGLYSLLQGYSQHPKRILQLPSGQNIQWQWQDMSSKNLWNLQYQVQMLDSNYVRFAHFTDLAKKEVSNALHKEDQQYIKMITFEYTGNARFGAAYLNKVIEEMRKSLPLGYSIERRQYSSAQGEKNRMYLLLLLVMSLIFFICSIQFESLRQAWHIIVLIPVSFIGIFLTFYSFDFPFDQGGYTSFILLSGLVVNSLILILSDHNRLRKKSPNLAPLSLYLRAFRRKITPILLSILSTALGLTPFLLDGSQEIFWFALAIGTIGGLLFSVFLLFFIVPVFFVKTSI